MALKELRLTSPQPLRDGSGLLWNDKIFPGSEADFYDHPDYGVCLRIQFGIENTKYYGLSQVAHWTEIDHVEKVKRKAAKLVGPG